MFAYIPARGGSRRIPKKNIKELGGKPIVGHVLDTLAKLEFLDEIYLSTDDPEIASIATAHGATCLELRDPSLATDAPGFIDLIREDIPRFSEASGGDQEVLFVLATAALVPAPLFEAAHARYRETGPDILMSCERYPTSPYWALTEEPDGYLRALFPDKVLINSQDLPTTLADAGLWYYFNLERMKTFESVKLADQILPFLVKDEYACDVDTLEDWTELQQKFDRLNT